MTTEQTKHIIQLLIDKGVHFDSGLTDDEVLQVETKFKFKFPPDLKLFLQTALPTSEQFVNWRLGLKSKDEAGKIVSRLDWPLDGLLFDLQHNAFWVDSWGKLPDNYDDKVLIAKRHYETIRNSFQFFRIVTFQADQTTVIILFFLFTKWTSFIMVTT